MVVVIAALGSVERTHKELIESQHATEDSIADVWRRIAEIESRQQSASEKKSGQAPPGGALRSQTRDR